MILLAVSYICIYYTVNTIFRKSSHLEKAALTTAVLMGISGFLPFIANEFFNITYLSSSLVIFSTTLIISAFVFLNKSRIIAGGVDLELGITGVVLILFSIVILARGYLLPLRGWDAFSLYDSRSMMFIAGEKLSDMKDFSDYDEYNNLYYFSYPPLTSVLHATFYSVGFNHVMVIYALFYIVFMSYIYLFLAELKINKFIAFLLFLIAAFNPVIFVHTKLAYTNLPAFTFQLVSLYYLVRYSKTKFEWEASFSALFIAFANWTRSLEPIFLSFIVAFFCLVILQDVNVGKKITRIIKYVAVSLSTWVLWYFYIKATIGGLGDTSPNIIRVIEAISNSLLLSNLLNIVFFLYTSLFPIILYLLLAIIIFSYFIIIGLNKISTPEIIISIIIILTNMTMIAGAMYFSVTFDWWDKIPDSYLRSNLILIPLSSILAGFSLENINTKKRKS